MYQAKKTEICLNCGVPSSIHGKFCKKKVKPKFFEFHSYGESERYVHLNHLVLYGAICDLQLQVPFELRPRSKHYYADFVYYDLRMCSFYHPGGRWVIEDYKGNYETEKFKKKWEMMKILYPKYVFRLTNKPNGEY